MRYPRRTAVSLLVGMIYGWIAVYAILGVYFLLLHARRSVGRDYLVFAVLCLVQGAYAYTCTRQYTAHDAAAAVRWASMRTAAGAAVAALFLDFVGRVAAAWPWQRHLRAGMYALAAVCALLALSGALLSRGVTVDRVVVFGEIVTRYHGLHHPWAAALVAPVVLAPLVATVGAAVAARREGLTSLKAIALASALVPLALVHDAVIWAAQVPRPYLAEHAYFAFAFVVSYVLTSRLAEELSKRERELAQLRDRLHAVREALERKEQLAAAGELSAIVAHEIRNPLAVITNAVASLRRDALPGKERATLLEILDEESTRLNRLVTDLLQLARPISPQRRPTDVAEVIERALEPARRTDTMVTVIIADEARRLLVVDAHLLRQALDNLIANAVQAMGGEGELAVRVELATRDGRPGWEIAVVDTGEGMNTDVRARARDPFFTTRATGTGLGLAIVDRITRAHGGTMDIDSARNMGTTVRLWLPDATDADTSGPRAQQQSA